MQQRIAELCDAEHRNPEHSDADVRSRTGDRDTVAFAFLVSVRAIISRGVMVQVGLPQYGLTVKSPNCDALRGSDIVTTFTVSDHCGADAPTVRSAHHSFSH
jgi:hypothetical protein